MTLTALYSRYGKKGCAFGAAAVLTADGKIIADEMRPGMVTSSPIAEALLRTFKVIFLDSRTLRRRSPDSPPCTLECPAEALLRTFKVIVLDSRTLHVAAVPTPPPAPSSAHGPGSRVTPTRTHGTQVRSRYNLLPPRAGPKTVPRTTVYGTTSRILPPS